MEKLSFDCRIEKRVREHAILPEFNLGDNKVCAQCLGGGVIGVMDRSDAKNAKL